MGGPFGEGPPVKLSDFSGKNVILYFYPKDDTPGCTTQACGLRDLWSELAEKAVVFGISTDSPKSHRKFIDKFSLPFPLLSDESQELVQAYGVWVEKSMYGKKYMGTERSTFIIGPDGCIKAVFLKVKPADHALPFPLLSDESQELVQAYGVWVEKSMYGKKYMGTERSTFIIGPDGCIKAVFLKVKPADHAQLVLEALK